MSLCSRVSHKSSQRKFMIQGSKGVSQAKLHKWKAFHCYYKRIQSWKVFRIPCTLNYHEHIDFIEFCNYNV